MPAVIPDNVVQARQSVQDAGNVLQQYAGGQYTIGDELKKVLNEATLPGKTDWSNITAGTMADYLNSQDEARAMYRDPESEHYIFNPIQSKAAMTEYSKASQIPFLASNSLFSLMTSGEKDMIDAGTRAFQAKQAAAQTAFQVAQGLYSNLLDEFKLQESSRQFDEELAIKKLQAANSGSGGKRSTQIVNVDGEQLLIDTQTGEIIQNLGRVSETPQLINIGDQPYQYTPSTGLKSVPGAPVADPGLGAKASKAIGDFFGWVNPFD